MWKTHLYILTLQLIKVSEIAEIYNEEEKYMNHFVTAKRLVLTMLISYGSPLFGYFVKRNQPGNWG